MRNLSVLIGLVTALGWTSVGSAISIEPDDFAPGTDISNAITGVTIYDYSQTGGQRFDPVYAVPSPYATTGSLVFGHDGNPHAAVDEWTHTNATDRATLWFQFDSPVRSISVDIIAHTTNALGGFSVQCCFTGNDQGFTNVYSEILAGDGDIQTLSIDSPGVDLYGVIIVGHQGSIAIDNFSFEPIPEPSTALLLGIGLSALAATRRCPS